MGTQTTEVGARLVAAPNEKGEKALDQVDNPRGKILRLNGTLLVTLVRMENALRKVRKVRGYTEAEESPNAKAKTTG
jgi:hypothetical protein